jgi:tetratricopeptide (TPR) repeat protein
MAEISLKEYISRVDSLLKEQASDEVVHHCRHILQYFPKNVAAYRALGVALADRSRWNDVAEVFRRVLSAYPDDETAHLGLSEAYEHTGKYEDAIWHLERAFEQESNNDTIISKLRELYLQHRNVEYPKVQLTAGAVARQYARNGLYDQAMNTLYQALERTPDRYDLRLLLAQMLWESGYRMDAAETALDVLSALPDCLQANRILTELWLSEGRPSDAQRYLSRIEALDPYLALELAHGQPPPDDVLKLQELDYERVASRELTTSAPDWLGELGSADSADWMASFKETPVQQAEGDTSIAERLETALPDDWLADFETEQPTTSAVPPPRKRTGATGLLSSLETPQPETPEEEAVLPDVDERPAADLFPVEAKPVEDEAVLDTYPVEAEETPIEAAPPVQRSAPADVDPLAWLHQSGVELVEAAEPAVPDLFGEDEDFVLQEPDKANPLAWLEGYGEEAAPDEGGVQSPAEEADPLAWLHQSGMETADDNQAVGEDRPAAPAAQADAQDEALLDWLADDSVLDEMLHMEALSTGTLKAVSVEQASVDDETLEGAEVEAVQEVEMPDDNEFNWLDEQQPEEEPAAADGGLDWLAPPEAEAAESAPEMSDWLAEPAPTDEPTGEPEPAAPSGEASLDWLAEPAPQADLPDWMAEAPATSSQSVEEMGAEWMAEPTAKPADTPDWLSAAAPEPAGETEAPQSADAGFDWLSGSVEPAAEAPTSEAADWLSEMSSVEEPQPEAGASVEWMSEAEPEAASGAETPDWLAEMAPVDASEAPQTDEVGFEWMAEGDAEPQMVTTETLDWLSASAPTDEPAGEPAQSEATAGVEWASEIRPEAEPSEMDDWLAAAAPAEPEFEASADAGLEWMSTTGEPEAASAVETPDWLAEMAPAGEVEQPTETRFEWMADAELEASSEAKTSGNAGLEWLAGDESVPEPAPTSETPDWLAEMAPGSETEASAEGGIEWMSEAEAAPPAETSMEWMSDAEAAPETVAPMDTPGWLSELGPSAEEPEAAAVSADPGWLSEVAPAGEPPAEIPEEEAEPVTGEMPDWLAAMAPAEQFASETGDVSAEELELDWPAEPMAAEDQPEWLSGLKPESAEPAEPAEPVTATSEFSWLNEMNTPEQPMGELEDAGYVDSGELEDTPAPPAPAENAPDWLNAMVPGLDVDYEAPEDEPIESDYIESAAPRREEVAATTASPTRDFEWLNQIVAEEALQPERAPQPAARRRFVFSRQPAWLRRSVERLDATPATAQPATHEDDDFPGWLRDDDAADKKDFDLPPWLQ